MGVSHPTVLHHFGSREGLIEAVVARALSSLHAGLVAAIQTAPKGPDQIATLLDRVSEVLESGGHARAFLWLALAGYDSTIEQLHVRSLSEAVHEVRRARRAELGKEKKTKPLPPLEDTYFTVLLPALALVSLSVTMGSRAKGGEPGEAQRFRAWLARLIHDHLENG